MRIYIGMGAPYVLQATALATPEFDPTDVVSSVFHVTKPDGTTVDWTATVATASAASIVVQQPLTGGLCDQTGVWRFWTEFTLSTGGTIRTAVIPFRVYPADAV